MLATWAFVVPWFTRSTSSINHHLFITAQTDLKGGFRPEVISTNIGPLKIELWFLELAVELHVRSRFPIKPKSASPPTGNRLLTLESYFSQTMGVMTIPEPDTHSMSNAPTWAFTEMHQMTVITTSSANQFVICSKPRLQSSPSTSIAVKMAQMPSTLMTGKSEHGLESMTLSSKVSGSILSPKTQALSSSVIYR